VVLSEELSILESCCLRPMMRNSVLEELRVRRFATKNNIKNQNYHERKLLKYAQTKMKLKPGLEDF